MHGVTCTPRSPVHLHCSKPLLGEASLRGMHSKLIVTELC